MTEETQVLIVGAGPTGLAAANAMAKLGIRARVIDKGAARSDKSKALGVQAGTLECLGRALDPALPARMVREGKPAREAWIHLNDRAPIRVNFSTIPSQYDFILILAQSETERILEEHLLSTSSLRVERRCELLSMSERDGKVESVVRTAAGETTIVSDFVIGCDGAHSAVRHQMDFSFKGDAYTGDFILGDVKMKWNYAYDSIRNFVSERGVIASFPMTGDRQYRLILIPKETARKDNGTDISLEEFRGIAALLSQDQIAVEEASWLTRFRVHHRMAGHFQRGRVFLAGDAAHIHSPAGGQGMNTGIQDALNLCFKLSDFFAGRRSFESLREYERERIPVARNVLRSTDFVFKMALLPESPVTRLLRGTLLPALVSSRFVQRHVTAAISEMRVANREMKNYPPDL
jgi:3-(3-hydroxy-phenyl)propionate hydroxylase